MDWERPQRTGLPEAVQCESKSPEQIAAILEAAGERTLFLTRLSPEKRAVLSSALSYHAVSRTAVWGAIPALTRTGAVVVAAGTSDMPVAEEARQTLRFHGLDAPLLADIGVAGLWRLLARVDEIRQHRVVIAVAGMEGALFTVLAGLVAAPVIAVPASVGYGVASGGHAALTSALASCSPGVVTVNIDNGYGAACAALRILGPAQ